MTTIGIIADLHGDLDGFQKALAIFDGQGIERILCAGDIVERGSDADAIIRLFKERDVQAIKGNHEHSVLYHQEQWRSTTRPERMRQLGRVIDDSTLDYIRDLPDSLSLTVEGIRILMAHGTPYSDVVGLFPDSRPAHFTRLVEHYQAQADILLLGHTHQPMEVKIDGLIIVNPGSVYNVTIRDSHSCATLSLPDMTFTVYHLDDGSLFTIPRLSL